MQTQVSVPFLQIMTESSNHFMRKEKENENEEKKISVTHTYACNEIGRASCRERV